MNSEEVKKRLVEVNEQLKWAKEFSRDMVRTLSTIMDIAVSLEKEQKEVWDDFMAACTGQILALSVAAGMQKDLIEDLAREMFPDEDWVVEKE